MFTSKSRGLAPPALFMPVPSVAHNPCTGCALLWWPYAVTTAGANVLAVVAVAGGGWAFVAARRVAVARAPRGESPLDTVHLYIFPPLRQDELAQGVSRLGDAPPDARVVLDVQVTGNRSVPKLLVVVRPAPAGVFDALLYVPQVDAFMQHGGDHVLDGPVERPRPDVQLVPGAVAPVPSLGDGHMAVGSRRALYRDDGFLQLVVGVFGVEGAEDFFQVSGGSGSLDDLFHFRFLAFKISNSKPDA